MRLQTVCVLTRNASASLLSKSTSWASCVMWARPPDRDSFPLCVQSINNATWFPVKRNDICKIRRETER